MIQQLMLSFAQQLRRWKKMSELFSNRTRRKVESGWHAYLDHPFVEGTLDRKKFEYDMKQDDKMI